MIFFEFIQIALGNQDSLTHKPTPEEWRRLFEMAKKQSLVGVCFAAIQRLPENLHPPELLYITWMGIAAKIQQRNMVVNRQCIELQERLSTDGFRSYIMKGQANAAFYILNKNGGENENKLCLLRQSGDIDVYIEGGCNKVLSYAKTISEVCGLNELEMHVNLFPDTEVEFHYRPIIMRNPFKNRKLQAFFESKKEVCFKNAISLPSNSELQNLIIIAPTTEFNLVHQLVHIHLHLFTEGIGLRQLMDYYFILNAVSKVPDYKLQEVLMVVSNLGLERFASALVWVIKIVFVGQGNSAKNTNWMLWKPNVNDGRFLLKEIMISGNFGRYDEAQNVRKGKMGYRVWSVFFRNLRLWRFDYSDWFWGPVWRITHKLHRV